MAGRGTSLRYFSSTGGFRMWSYRSSRAGEVITSANMPAESQGGNTYKSLGVDTNKEGALAFTVSSGYYRSMIDIGSWSDFEATFTQYAQESGVFRDPTECTMNVTQINDGAIYRGQPIYATGTSPSLNVAVNGSPGATDTNRWTFSNVNNGTYSDIIGWVIGFEGDTISTVDSTSEQGYPIVTSNYDDGVELTGRGGIGVYRVQLNESYTSVNESVANLTFSSGVTASINVKGQNNTTDYFPYGANQRMWWNEPGSGVYRYIWKRRVVDEASAVSTGAPVGTNIVYFRYSNNVGAGLTALYDSTYNGGQGGYDFTGGQTSLYSGAYVLFYYQGRRSNVIKLALDKPLCEDVTEGTVFTLAPTPNRDSSGLKLFKSRILDIKKSQNHSQSRLKITQCKLKTTQDHSRPLKDHPRPLKTT